MTLSSLCSLCAFAPFAALRETSGNILNEHRKIWPYLMLIFWCSVFCSATNAQNPSVTKVDPPSWWAKHTIRPLRLLVRGTNLRGAHVRALNPEMLVSEVSVNERGTYVFADVEISPSLRPGKYPLLLETASGSTMIPFTLEAPLDTRSNFQGITNDDVIYLIMTDRFADGDPSNNAAKDSPPEANDRSNPRSFHGGDLRGVINQLPYLKDLGVTAIWLTPWYDNWNGVNRCGKPWCPNTYYHGYHAIDYYAVEDRFRRPGDTARTGPESTRARHKDHSGSGSESCRLATSMDQRSAAQHLVSRYARTASAQQIPKQRPAVAAFESEGRSQHA
jgi:hypothetical protein